VLTVEANFFTGNCRFSHRHRTESLMDKFLQVTRCQACRPTNRDNTLKQLNKNSMYVLDGSAAKGEKAKPKIQNKI